MKDWNTDKIIAVGLMAAFVITVIAMDISAVWRGDMDISAIAKELAIGLFSYMSRSVVQSVNTTSQQESGKTVETLGKVAETAGEAQKIVQAVENLKTLGEK